MIGILRFGAAGKQVDNNKGPGKITQQALLRISLQ
jgi:hypothetical protein